MPCTRPIKGYRHDDGVVRFSRARSGDSVMATVVCGQCAGCRKDRALEWAVRCYHENLWHGGVGQFVTLTYNEQSLPSGGSLVKKDFQDFMKRMRKRRGEGIRYYMCGEYGDKNMRPHYHMLLFNKPFEDLVLCNQEDEKRSFQSAELLDCWRLGNCQVDALSLPSVFYVSGYIRKKWTGDKAKEVYGERIAPYNDMSRGSKNLNTGGIGRDFCLKYWKAQYDFFFVDGMKMPVPKYYDKVMWEYGDAEIMRRIAYARRENTRELSESELRRLDEYYSYIVEEKIRENFRAL